MSEKLPTEPVGPTLDEFAMGVRKFVEDTNRYMQRNDRWRTLCFLLRPEDNHLETIPVTYLGGDSDEEVAGRWAHAVAEEAVLNGVQLMALVSEAERMAGEFPVDIDVQEAFEQVNEAILRGEGQRCLFLTVFDREVAKTWVCDVLRSPGARPRFGEWHQYPDNADLGFITEILQQSMR